MSCNPLMALCGYSTIYVFHVSGSITSFCSVIFIYSVCTHLNPWQITFVYNAVLWIGWNYECQLRSNLNLGIMWCSCFLQVGLPLSLICTYKSHDSTCFLFILAKPWVAPVHPADYPLISYRRWEWWLCISLGSWVSADPCFLTARTSGENWPPASLWSGQIYFRSEPPLHEDSPAEGNPLAFA